MMGLDDWMEEDFALIANPKRNGLKYLSDYPLEEAVEMIRNDDYIKAIFLRDPKHRVLSAFLNEGLDDAYMESRCCPEEGRCADISRTFEGFLNVISVCQNPVWIPQSWRMEGRYWPYMNFIGTLENAPQEVQVLLESIDAWEDFGARGWGQYGNDPAFPWGYITNSWDKFGEYYTPEIEKKVEEYYAEDYSNSFMPYMVNDDEFIEVAAEDYHDETPDDQEDLFDQAEEEAIEQDEEDLGVESVVSCGKKIDEPIPTYRKSHALLHTSFYVYKKGPWDGAPVVIEDSKLIFFTVPEVAATTFKQLFRRMMGYEDWHETDDDIPHNPRANGLKYLYDYDLDEAGDMLTSDEWTRAIFVRDPKERILDAFLTRVIGDEAQLIRHHCCKNEGRCADKAMESFLGFMKVANACCNSHWMPQTWRMEARYWPFIDYVGHVDNVAEDAQILLEKIGKWDDFGASGWGELGDLPIFGSTFEENLAKAYEVMAEYYNDETEAFAETMYAEDYENQYLGLEMIKVMKTNDNQDNYRRQLKNRNPFRSNGGARDVETAKQFIRDLVTEEQYEGMLRKSSSSKTTTTATTTSSQAEGM